jgi:16S rRNA (adenine1518-N6/adenine1519-N6)-dimethyltransferase
MNLTNIAVIKDLLKRYDFKFSKALGQNFLINPSICPKMAELCGANTDVGVIEIGPGIGVLTNELAKTAKKVVAIELDNRLIPILGETLADFNNVKVINQDVLKTDLTSTIKEEFPDMEVVICANLPYYITSPIIMNILGMRYPIKALIVMVQKEVAERLCADVGTREAGAVTIAVQYFSEPKNLFPVSRGSFLPSPKVDSAVIRLDIRQKPPIEIADQKLFFQLVKAAFGQRRKVLTNSIPSATDITKERIIDALNYLKLSYNARAEELTMQKWGELANCFSSSKL